MMRFSELELKEKEGGVAVSRELAAGQRGEGDWEHSQACSKPAATALTEQPERNGKSCALSLSLSSSSLMQSFPLSLFLSCLSWSLCLFFKLSFNLFLSHSCSCPLFLSPFILLSFSFAVFFCLSVVLSAAFFFSSFFFSPSLLLPYLPVSLCLRLSDSLSVPPPSLG